MDGKVGLELYDTIEQIVKKGGEPARFAIMYLAYGSGESPSPLWMRDGFQSTMASHGDEVIEAINKQLVIKGGTKVAFIMVGHTPNEKGRGWGNLFGADDSEGSPVILDLIHKSERGPKELGLRVLAQHNFAQLEDIESEIIKI